jgi:hypothetical protein
MIGGTTGGGIEFVVPTNYTHGKGQSASPSGVTAQVAGLLACLKYRHPSWIWFDVKAAVILVHKGDRIIFRINPFK